MSMTPASSKYFQQVSEQWDSIRAGYFSESVRQAAIRKAYLRPEMVVADVGAGTGFMSAGLAPLVQKVYLLDGSTEMLAVAQQNLKAYDNLVFQQADGLALPLPDQSLDAVFANMYLHHMPEPLKAIQEMVRLLRPGGRLVLSDMDTHPYEWMKKEMADIWQGFERDQIRLWFQEAGLVNVIVDCSGETCCAESQDITISDPEQREAKVSVFVAVGTRRISGVLEAVRSGYSQAASRQGSCCTDSPSSSGSYDCCGNENAMEQLIQIEDSPEARFIMEYSPAEKSQVPQEAAEISLGCGNPTAMAALKPGEVVLDIGSGGGLDAFLAARQIGPLGQVIGVDMTPAMIERARRAAQNTQLQNVEFRLGQAEALPLPDESVDVVISNCVINLTADKGVVFREIYRVLKPGGRLEVSDVVSDRALPLDLLQNPETWAGCITGALPEQEYLDLVQQAGFQQPTVRRSAVYGSQGDVSFYSAQVSAVKN
jgi:arsenite methyltransferase